jgi:hypothetical protein
LSIRSVVESINCPQQKPKSQKSNKTGQQAQQRHANEQSKGKDKSEI